MENAPARLSGQLVTGDALHRRRTPVGAHVGENLRRVGEQVAKEHGSAVEESFSVAKTKGSRMPFQSKDVLRMASMKSPLGK